MLINIYGIQTRMHLGENEKYDKYTPYLYKDIGVDYNKKDIYYCTNSEAFSLYFCIFMFALDLPKFQIS